MDSRDLQSEICNIPCITAASSGEPIGCIVLVHGWGSTNESYRFFASLLAGWGYRVVIPELPHHGVRGSLDYWTPEALQEHFWNVVARASRKQAASRHR